MILRFARLAFRSLVVAIALGPGNATAAQALDPDQSTRAPWRGDLQHTAWTRKDGAPSAVNSMAQDGNGLLWFAASDGLYSFDGARFARADRVHGHPLLSPVTVAVAAFGDTIWVGYQFGGISRFDRDSVRHYRPGVDAPLGSAHRIIRTPDGTIWVAESRGLARLRDDRWELVDPREGLPESEYPTIALLKDGSLLVTTADGLYRRAAGAMPGVGQFRKLLGHPGIVAAMEQPDGRLLIETRENGLELFNPASGARKPLRPRQRDAHVLGYLSDARGGLWVSTGDAVQLLDGEGSLIKRFPISSGFSAGSFTGLLSDREGNAWIATPNGIDRVRQARLSTIDLPSGFSSALGVTAGVGGAVWISETFSPGAFKAPTFVQFPDGTRRATAMRAVSCGHRQPDGTLWFGNRNNLWRVRDGVTRHWALPSELTGFRLQSMVAEADGTLWVSIVGKGIYTFHEGIWRAANGDRELARQSAIILARDRQDRIWFGYPGDQIAVLDGGIMRRFGPEQGVAIGNTLAITAGRDRIWFGGDKGLAWFDGERFHDIGERDAGGFRGVSGIVERDDHELWLHDAGGLVRIAPTELAAAGGAPGALVRAERFDHLDGHQGTTPQDLAATKPGAGDRRPPVVRHLEQRRPHRSRRDPA